MNRRLKHYDPNVILAVGYRVRLPRGTQFRQSATARYFRDSPNRLGPLAQDHKVGILDERTDGVAVR